MFAYSPPGPKLLGLALLARDPEKKDTRRFLNRVAIPDKNAKARAGGLEVAVKAALTQKSGNWFGWSGKVAHSH
ncbi:MAG: hypothetical protein WCD82_16470, partial [Xanthobacteraceae bacterium]